MEILVVGGGCADCDKMYSEVQAAVEELGLQATVRKVEDLVEMVRLGVCSLPDNAALPDGQGRLIHNGGLNPLGTVLQRVNLSVQADKEGRLQLLKLPLHLRQCPQSLGKPQKVPAVDGAGDDSRHHPLQIGNIPEGFLQLASHSSGGNQLLHGALPAVNLSAVQQGLFNPAAQQPSAHGGVGLVQHPQKGAFLFLAPKGFRKLQIPPGIHIQLHEFAGGVVLQLTDVGQVVFL